MRIKCRGAEIMVITWIIVAVILSVVEASTAALVSVWFVLGAIAAAIAAAVGGQVWLQIAVFAVVSIAAMLAAKPLIKKYVMSRRKPTNADRLFGMTGLVTEEIDNIANRGSVSVSGQVWTARSGTGENIAEGEKVRPVSIDGVKLIVVRAENAEKSELLYR